MTEEIFDVVDERDKVVGQAPRGEVHARGLLHRAVHVFVFNSSGELLVQLRSASKDEYPLCYTSSASGHLSAGETYDEAAPRELAEELGLEAPLEFLHKFAAGPETANEHTALYRTVTDEEPVLDVEEIADGRFMGREELSDLMHSDPQRISPPFRTLWGWYVKEFAPAE